MMHMIPLITLPRKIVLRRAVYGILLLLSLLFHSLAYAIAPVEDAYEDSDDDAPVTSSHTTSTHNSTNALNTVSHNAATFSLEQRVTILERQITNLNPLLVQMDDLRQQLQQLQGRIETQQHRISQLEDQLRSRYLAVEKQRVTPRANPATYTSSTVVKPMLGSNSSIKNVPSAPSPAAERAYQAAFQLLKGKQYNEAIEAFESFSKKYPNDANVANANYFLGQLYLLQGQPERAIERFQRFTSRYNQDPRVPDAMLQLGLAYFAKGDKDSAIALFEKIIQQYPDSKAAQAAQARLQQFKAMVSAINTPQKKL